ncbi:MAG: hypothetical protein KTR19_03450 [Hyphomicrobiales bacterium]|nr:hypothetical protein [Hyphomicrobiales bacterium]
MDFWKSAGLHLVKRNQYGWLTVTPDYLRAYYTRPEIHPVEESCAAEHALFEKLMDDPFAQIGADELSAIADGDAAENYRILLRFRDHLAAHGTLEQAYAALFTGDAIAIPPMFIDQMVHLILASILRDVTDPIQLRAAELFFREQAVTAGEDQLMLADKEILEMRAHEAHSPADTGILQQLLAGDDPASRDITLDVLTDENKTLYWDRSDQFDTAIDFRFTQPAPDALGRVIEAWIRHFLRIETRIEARQSIRDDRWSWHVGLDAEATRILNALYNGEDLPEEELFRVIALYRLEFLNPQDAMDTLAGKPVYLGLAMSKDKSLVLKPQNLLINLPLRRD